MAQSVPELARSLVERARAGDQNAMALIAEVRTSAPKSERARAVLGAIFKYCETNPVDTKEPAFIGAEADPVTPDSAKALGTLKAIAKHAPEFPEDEIAGCLCILALDTGSRSKRTGALLLANGARLTGDVLDSLAHEFANPDTFIASARGIVSPKQAPPPMKSIALCGRIAATGRAIQLARRGSLIRLSPRASAEIEPSRGKQATS